MGVKVQRHRGGCVTPRSARLKYEGFRDTRPKISNPPPETADHVAKLITKRLVLLLRLCDGFRDTPVVGTVAYARVSTEAQDTRLQRDALHAAGYVKLFEDKLSSRNTDRPGLAAALDYLRAGDEFLVWKLDRLGRSVKEVLTLADQLHERGIGLRILTGTLAGNYTDRRGQVFLHRHGRVR